jgi:hypothetical protein
VVLDFVEGWAFEIEAFAVFAAFSKEGGKAEAEEDGHNDLPVGGPNHLFNQHILGL